ncbi:MAG: tol-pal system protein YbgF [Pseudohongiellaceae bacterium]
MQKSSLNLISLTTLALVASWGGVSLRAAEPANDALIILLDQNRGLQVEVQALRALVEQQGFEIRTLQRESLDRYRDMDTRLGALEQSRPIAEQLPTTGITSIPPVESTGIDPGSLTTPQSQPLLGNSSVTSGATAGSIISSPVPGTSLPLNTSRPSLEPVVLSEQELYQMAYESAINSQFERAIAEFDQYLGIYPNGRFTTNAHYWKGQSYLYLSRYQEAVNAYEIILQQYPDAAKVADAMYGVGVAYEGMGNIARARQIMQDIKRRFPNTGVANLADTRLLSMQ